MKRYIVFTLSFIVIFYLTQFIWGYILSIQFHPNPSFNKGTTSTVEFGKTAQPLFFFISTIIAFIISFFIPLLPNRKNKE